MNVLVVQSPCHPLAEIPIANILPVWREAKKKGPQEASYSSYPCTSPPTRMINNTKPAERPSPPARGLHLDRVLGSPSRLDSVAQGKKLFILVVHRSLAGPEEILVVIPHVEREEDPMDAKVILLDIGKWRGF
jgi:hypothetical protein